MARRTERTVEKTTNELFFFFFDGIWANTNICTINLSSLRNFAKMCRAIYRYDQDTFTAHDLGVSGATLMWASSCSVIKFNRRVVERTRTEYQQVDNPDKRITLVRTTKLDSFVPYNNIDYKALAEYTEQYVINQIKNI